MSVGVAILREQLFDISISLVLNRSLVYATLTLLLAGVYVGTAATAGLLLGDLRAGDRVSDRDPVLLARLAQQIAAATHSADLTAALRHSRQQVITAVGGR